MSRSSKKQKRDMANDSVETPLAQHDLAALNRLGELIRSASDPDQICTHLLEVLGEYVPIERAALFLLDESSESMRLVEGHNLPSSTIETTPLDLEGHPVREVAKGAPPQLVEDTAGDRRFDNTFDTLLNPKTAMAMPLSNRDRILGVLYATNSRPGESFTAEHLSLAQMLATWAALAIDNVYLHTTQRRRLQEIATIAEIDHELSSTLDFDRVINLMLDRAMEATAAAAGMIATLTPRKEGLLLVAARGAPSDIVERYRHHPWEVEKGIIGRVSTTGRSALVPDVREDPDYVDVTGDTRSELAVPILREDEVIGVINLESDELLAFNEDDLAFVEGLAEHAGIAMENARLLMEEQRRAQEMSVIAEIGRTISASLDLRTTLDTILACVKRVVAHDAGEICLWEKEKGAMVTASRSGDPTFVAERDYTYYPDEGYTGWIISNKEPLLVSDVSEREDIKLKVPQKEFPARSYIGAPLVIGDELIGTLELGSTALGAFDEKDMETLLIVASQAAIAIDNARLYDESQGRFKQSELFRAVSEAVASTLDLTEMLRRVCREMVRATGADTGAAYLLDSLKTGLKAVAGYRVPHERLAQYREYVIPVVGHPFLEQAWESGKLVFSSDAQHDSRLHPEVVRLFPCQAVTFAPLQVQDQIVGGMWLVWWGERRAFSEDEVRLLDGIAKQVSVAVGNARLYEETRRRVDEMAGLFQASIIASSTLDLDELLGQTVAEMARFFQTEMAVLLLYDEVRRELAARPSGCFGLTQEQVESFRISADVEGFDQTLFKRGRPFFTNDAENDPNIIKAYKPFVRPFGVTKFAGAPLRTHDRSIGEIYVINKRTGSFTRDDMRLLFTVGTTIASAIDNARLFGLTDERLREKITELTALQRIGQELHATLDMDEILPRVLAEAVNGTAATHGSLRLFDAIMRSFQLKALHGYSVQEADSLQEVEIQVEGSIVGRVAKTGRAARVADVEEDPDYLQVLSQTRSELAVPIRYGRDVVGVINLESPEVAAFDEDDVEFVEALAVQAAVAIGNAVRYQAQVRRGDILRQRAEQLSDLSKITNAFRTDQPLQDLLEEIVLSIRDTVGFNIVLLSLVEGDPPHLRRVAQAGIPLALFEEIREIRQPLKAFENMVRDEFRISQSYFFPHERQEEWHIGLDTYDLMEVREEVGEGEWHPEDMLLIPLRSTEGEILGIMSVDDPQDGQIPSEATVEIVELFAAQAAIAVENARLYEQTRRRAIQLEAVGEISRRVSSILDPHELFSQVVELIRDRLGYYQVHIFFVDPGSEYAVYGAGAGEAGRQIAQQGFRLKVGEEGIVGWVAAKGGPLLVNDVSQDPRYVASEFLPDTKAELAVPLKVGEQVVGVLDVQSDQPGAFGEDDLFVLRSAADQIAVAVQNARFFEEIKGFSAELEQRVERRTEELAKANLELTLEKDRAEALYRIAKDLSASLDLDRVLSRALDLVTEAVGATHGSIMLLDLKTGHLIHRMAKGGEKPLPRGGEMTSFKPGVGLAGWMMEQRRPVIIGDVSKDKRWKGYPGERKSKSALGAPLMIGEDILGVLLLFNPETHYFVPQHLTTVKAAASQVAAAINNAELYRLITDQAERVSDMLRAQWAESSKTEAILESIVDGVVVFDADNRVTLINPAAGRMLGLSEETVKGQTLMDLIERGDVSEVEGISAIQSALLGSRASFDEGVTSTPLKIEIGDKTISVAFAPVLLEERENVVGAFRDISKEAEIDRMKSEFISTVSHELRTPMTSIKGYTDLLYMETVGEVNEGQRRFLTIIRNNVGRLTALVSDLLDISRIETGRIKLEMMPLHMGEIISQTAVSLEGMIGERQHALVLNVPDDLPSVWGDQDRVTQIVTNLMANACQYTPLGGRIEVSASCVDNLLLVDVSDNGIGISADDCERVFDRFYRVDHPLVQENRGTGLGLSIVKMFVEMHGGQVWVKSQPGKGSTFSFTLPLMGAEEGIGK